LPELKTFNNKDIGYENSSNIFKYLYINIILLKISNHGEIMPLAFVLLNVETGEEKEVLEDIRKIPEVKASHMVYGVYDIVAMLESDTIENLREMVVKKIRQLDNVRSTMTMMVMEN